MNPPPTLSIGELARRTGLSVSAIRSYEGRGLVRATRGAGNQRRFLRSDIRRLSFALIAQQLGLTLSEIEAELSTLPRGQAPTLADWRAIGTRMRGALAAKIAMLQKTHELLDGCIGCGCLSLDRCALFNPNDRAARAGPGPRFLLGDKASDFEND
jgi:MerR family transcriptional regulator, redox-sensitive transcriptional activator SoxR